MAVSKEHNATTAVIALFYYCVARKREYCISSEGCNASNKGKSFNNA